VTRRGLPVAVPGGSSRGGRRTEYPGRPEEPPSAQAFSKNLEAGPVAPVPLRSPAAGRVSQGRGGGERAVGLPGERGCGGACCSSAEPGPAAPAARQAPGGAGGVKPGRSSKAPLAETSCSASRCLPRRPRSWEPAPDVLSPVACPGARRGCGVSS